MSPSPLAAAHQARVSRLVTLAAREAVRAWTAVDREDIRGSWQARLGAVVAAVAAAQLAAAQDTEPFLMRLLGREVAPPPSVRLNARAMAGVTVDGRPLAPVLSAPMIGVLVALSRGVQLQRAMASGQATLDLTVRTVVADTARAADEVGMYTRPAVTSYIRVVSGGACDRCMILAGREYGISTGFQRHPRCDCTMEPVTREHRPEPQNPRALFDALTPEQQARRFTIDGAKAIRDGADPAQVVNARRGMTTAAGYRRKLTGTTAEGITRRGIAGRQRQRAGIDSPRLTPQEIYARASSREQAIELLRQHSYLI